MEAAVVDLREIMVVMDLEALEALEALGLMINLEEVMAMDLEDQETTHFR